MVLRIQYLKYHVSSGQLVPYFLGRPGDEEMPQRLIAHLEAYVGKPRSAVDLDTPQTWASDVRVTQGLVATALTRFYSFIPQELEALASATELTELHRQGVSSLEDLRLWFWRFVEERCGGFMLRSDRERVLAKSAEVLHLQSATVERLLTAHRDEHMLLRRRNGCPSAQNLVGAYNFDVLETLLYNAESVVVTVSGKSLGSAARALLRLTKRFGVLVDMEQVGSALRATIIGPRVFFARASPFGWNIAQVLLRLMEEPLEQNTQVIDLTIDVILRDRHYVVRLPLNQLPSLFPPREARSEETFLDSKVEEQFYWSWRNNKFRGWEIIREPDALIVGDMLIIPDFALVKGDHKVLVEIVGYWREEYTEKKQAQLQALKRQGLTNLILLVDKKHEQAFAKTVYPTFYFRTSGRRYEIPYGKLLQALPE
jgi:predicted nuclease of restriction endonuclease-like RecB superfamily